MRIMRFRVVKYLGENTWTKGWKKLYTIQPVQAYCNGDYYDMEDFIEAVYVEVVDLMSNEKIDVPDEILDEFMYEVEKVGTYNDNISWVTLEVSEN